MKENIEEDMKRLEKISECFNYSMWEEDTNALKHILSDYKRVYQENEELKHKYDKALGDLVKVQEENKKLEEANKCYINSIHSIVPVLNQDYIEKQKIQDKIEEYKKLGNEFYEKFLETNKTDINIHDAGISCDAKVQALQDLLESEGK